MFEPLSRFTNTNCTGHSHKLLLREKPLLDFSNESSTNHEDNGTCIDAQPRGGNRQTAKGFCILYSFFRFVVERFESVYQLRMRVYLCTNLGVHKDQL